MKRTIALVCVGAMVLAACGTDTSEPIPVEPAGGIGDDAEPLPDLPTGGPYPIADLTVTVEHPDADTIEYQISCLGDTASVIGVDIISAEAACIRLAEPMVESRLVSPPLPGERVCTDIYGGPDIARIEGTLNDQAVNTTIDRTNGCGISDWDNLLVGILPPAIGVLR
jgi:hypothetical protein